MSENADENGHEFKRYLQALGRRERTVEQYTYYVRRMLRWLDGESNHAWDVAGARAFLTHLAADVGFAAATYNIAFNAVRHWLHWRLGEEEVDLRLKPQPKRAAPKRIHSREQVQAVLESVTAPRLRVVLTVMYSLGLRLCEVIALRVSDIEPDEMILIRKGKGGKPRRIPLPEQTRELLRDYWRRWRPADLFFTQRGAIDGPALRTDTIQNALRTALRKHGLQQKGSCTHVLRHCFAHHQVAAGCDLRSLQHCLGHASLNTTLQYLGDLDALRGHRPPVVDLLADVPLDIWRDTRTQVAGAHT